MPYDRNRPVLDREGHQIFTLRQIWETVTAGRNPTIFNFIDLRKA